MVDSSAYLCLGFLFVILVVLFAVSMRTSRRTHRYCQSPAPCSNECKKCDDSYLSFLDCKKNDPDAYKNCKICKFKNN